MSDSVASPFEVLGLAPTGDPVAVKRAYFAALVRHPPHADPEGFRRIRGAYETLTAPGGLRAALALTPPDPKAELARYRARFDDLLAEVAGATQAAMASAEAGTRFKQAVMRMSLDEALTAFAPRPG